MKLRQIILTFSGVVLLVISSWAAIPQLMNFQGLLKDGSGNPVPNGSYSVVFTIYDAATGGTNLWTETQSVTTIGGNFTTLLGSGTAIPDSIFNDSTRYLGIKVGGDPEMTPRQRLASVGYSYVSSQWTSVGQDLYRSGSVGIGTASSLDTKLYVYNLGSAFSLTGVRGEADNSGDAYGGRFIGSSSGSGSSFGVHATGGTYGVYGSGGSVGGHFAGTDGTSFGVDASGGITGVYGSGGVVGGRFAGTDGTSKGVEATGGMYGVYGDGGSYGVAGNSFSGTGVYGQGGTFGGHFEGTDGGYGVSATGDYAGVSASGGFIGGEFGGTFADSYGVYATGGRYGVYGQSSGIAAVFGNIGGNLGTWGGYFQGDVHVDRNLVVVGTVYKGGLAFKIDHPLDPSNKYLYHSGVESPDMKNIYDGIVTTDAKGNATVTLPDWFGALNRDFRYQLTVIGGFAQAIISEKIKENQFSIKTDKPNIEVSWQVTGIRQDAYANAHRIPVEEEKSAAERGKYLHPKELGMSETLGINYEMTQKMELERKQMEEQQAKMKQEHQ